MRNGERGTNKSKEEYCNEKEGTKNQERGNMSMGDRGAGKEKRVNGR